MKEKVIKRVIKKRIVSGLLVFGIFIGNASLFAESPEKQIMQISDFVDYEETGEKPYQIKEVTEKTPEEMLLLPEKMFVVISGEQQEIPVSWQCEEEYLTTQNDTYTYTVVLPQQYECGLELQELINKGEAKLPYITVVMIEDLETVIPPSNEVEDIETPESNEVVTTPPGEELTNTLPNEVPEIVETEETPRPTISTEKIVSNEFIKMQIVGNGNFDIQGKIDGQYRKTTYDNRGYLTKLQVGQNAIEDVTINTIDDVYSSTKDSSIQVERILSVDGKLARVTYKITNTSTTNKTVKIGNGTDIQVGSDDSATVYKTNVGLRMTSRRESDNGLQFNLIAKDNAIPVDTMWMGHYTEMRANIFNNSTIEKLENTDSGIAFSWNKEIPAGQTVTVNAEFFAGKAPTAVSSGSQLESENGNINVSQNYSDTVGSINTLYASLDNGPQQSLATLTTQSAAVQTIVGSLAIPTNWQDKSVHEVSWWIENESYSASEKTTVRVVYYKNENKVVIETPSIVKPTPQPVKKDNNIINTGDHTDYKKYTILLMSAIILFIGCIKKKKEE